jgi:hypothetical protein
MKTLAQLLLLFLIVAGPLVAYGQSPSIEAIIENDGVFAISDGSSTFQFHKGGEFVLEPVGMSGRTIVGTWKKTDGGHFTVVGTWAWVNGVSAAGDYRRMKMHISYHGEAAKPLLRGGVSAYPCYFVIDEIVEIDKAEHDRGL